MLGQVGCADYSARIVTRGALAVVWEEIPFTSLDYERVLDDTSQANIIIDGLDPGCDARVQYNKVRPWQHELVIYRNKAIAWAGPVVGFGGKYSQGKIRARDRSVWWDHRWVSDLAFVQRELADIFVAYFASAMNQDPIAGFTLTATATGILGTRSVAASDHKPAGPEMREVSQVGIDWTVVGLTCVAGGKTIPTGRLPVISDDHLREPPDIDCDGLAQMNVSGLTGQQPQDSVTGQFVVGDRVYGQASDAARTARDGLLQSNVQDDKAGDVPSCIAGAASTLALFGDAPILVSSLALASNAPVTMDTLVPGAILDVELRANATDIAALYRIAKVNVVVDTDGERVDIDVQPIGTT